MDFGHLAWGELGKAIKNETLYCLQCKQFQLVDSILFDEISLAVFSDAVKIFFGHRWL